MGNDNIRIIIADTDLDFAQLIREELEQKDYEHVLIACHGGIMRALSGYLMDRKNGICWRPKPRNCEIRVFEQKNGKHQYLEDLKLP